MSDINLIRDFIAEHLLRSTAAPADDDALLTSGLIDSLAVIRLVDFLEQQFSIRVAPEAVTLENFETLAAMDAYVAAQRG